MLKRRGSFQTVILIICALFFIILTPKPSNGWESLSGSGSPSTPPPQAVPTSPPPRSPTQGASAAPPSRQSDAFSNRVSSPSSVALQQGRTIAVISNTHPREYTLFRDWAGRQDSIELILEPSSLDDLGKKLETLGRGRKISKLIFVGHGIADMERIAFIAPNESTIDEQSFITLAQNHPKLGEAFLPGAHGGFVLANKNLTRFITERDQDGNLVVVWLDSPDWYCYPWVSWDAFLKNVGENINRWRVGWTAIEIFQGHVRVSPIINGTYISINSSWGTGPTTKCLTPTEERVECNRQGVWCEDHDNPCRKCPSRFFRARHNGVDICLRCPNGMTYSQNDNRCH